MTVINSSIAIKKYVDTQDAKKVSKAGDTMTGNLILNGAKHIVKQSVDYQQVMLITDDGLDNTVNPSGHRLQTFLFTDKNGVETGAMEHIKFSDGGNAIQFNARDKAGNWMGQPLLVYKSNVAEFILAPTPSNKAENSRIIPTTEWVNSASTVVHTTGNETIAGTKIFTSPTIVKQTANTIYAYRVASLLTSRDSTPSSTLSVDMMRVEDGSGLLMAGVGSDFTTENARDVHLSLRFNKYNYKMGLSSNGTSIWGYSPTPPSSATGTEIATAKWVNSASTVVHTTGNETIAGTKIFTSPTIVKQTANTIYAYRVASLLTSRDSTPSSTLSVDMMRVEDGSGLLMAGVGSDFTTENARGVHLTLRFNKCNYKMGLSSNGTSIWGYSPTPPSSATGTEIATAKWVNDKLSGVPTKTSISRPAVDQLLNAPVGATFFLNYDDGSAKLVISLTHVNGNTWSGSGMVLIGGIYGSVLYAEVGSDIQVYFGVPTNGNFTVESMSVDPTEEGATLVYY